MYQRSGKNTEQSAAQKQDKQAGPKSKLDAKQLKSLVFGTPSAFLSGQNPDNKQEGAVQAKPVKTGSGTQTKLPEDVQSKMNASFGTNFDKVEMRKDDSSASQMGALAYTQGNTVSFAPGQYQPNTQKGQELIGHELTHVQQQRAGRVKPTTGTPKMQPTVVGKTQRQKEKETQLKETFGSHHRSPEQKMQLQLKYGAAELDKKLAQARFSSYKQNQLAQLKRNKTAARAFNSKANAFERTLVQRKIGVGSPEYIQLAKDHFPGFDPLPTDMQAKSAMPEINDSPALEHEADVMGKRAAEGKPASPSNTAPATVIRKKEARNQQISAEGNGQDEALELSLKNLLLNPYETVVELMDKLYPVGFGAQVQGGVGINYKIFGANADLNSFFYKSDPDHFIIKLFTKGEGGLEVGAGTATTKGKGKNKFGAEAGAAGRLMVGLVSEVEYKFPFKEDASLISILAAILNTAKPLILGKDLDVSIKIVYKIIEALMGDKVDPEQYVVKAKNGLSSNISVDAMASAGVGKDTTKGKGKTATKYVGSKPADVAELKKNPLIGTLLTAKADANIHLKSLAGVEMDVLERDKETDEIQKAKGSLFGQVSAGAAAKLPMLPTVGKNHSYMVKCIFLYDGKNEQQNWSLDSLEFVSKQGELDYYEGAASETKLNLSLSDIENWNSLNFIKFLKGFSFKKRFNIAVNANKGYASVMKKQLAVPSLLKKDYKAIGGSLGAYLTLELDFSGLDENDKKLNGIFNQYIGAKENQHLYIMLHDFMTSGKHYGLIVQIIDYIAELNTLAKADLTYMVSIGTAGGIGVKGAALSGHVQNGFVYTQDILQEVKQLFVQYKSKFLTEYIIQEKLASEK